MITIYCSGWRDDDPDHARRDGPPVRAIVSQLRVSPLSDPPLWVEVITPSRDWRTGIVEEMTQAGAWPPPDDLSDQARWARASDQPEAHHLVPVQPDQPIRFRWSFACKLCGRSVPVREDNPKLPHVLNRLEAEGVSSISLRGLAACIG